MIYLCAMFSPRLLDTPDRTPTGFRPTLTLPTAPAARPERANPRGGSSRQRVVGTRPLFVVLVPRDRSPRTRPGRPKSDVSSGAASGTLHGRVTGPRGRTPQQCKDRSVFLLRPTVANTPSTDAFHSGCTALPAAHRASQCCTRMVSTACFVASELRVVPIVTTVDAMRPSVIEHPNTDTISTPVPGECCRRSRMLAGVMGRTGRKGSDQRRMRVHRAVAGRRRRSRGRAHGSPSTTQHGMEAELVPFAPPNDGPKRGDTSSTHSLRVRLMDRGDQVHVMTMYNSALLRFLDRNRYRIFPTNYITFERTLFIVSWLRVESMWNFFVLLVPSTHPPPYSDRCDCSSCRWYRTSRQ